MGGGAQKAERRRRADEDGGGERRGRHEREDRSDGGDLAHARDSAGHEGGDSAESRHGKTQAHHPAAGRHHQILGERLADQPGPRGTECGAEFHLGSPGQAPRENEMRHIRARNQEDEPGSPEERPERQSKG